MSGSKFDLSVFPESAQAELRRALLEEGALTPADYFQAEQNVSPTHGVTTLSQLAKQLKLMRDRREEYFDKSLFAEPAWDIMLALYIAKAEGYRVSVSDAVVASSAPSTTALRWIEVIERNKLLIRTPHPTDRRIKYVEMPDEAFDRMTDLLVDIEKRLVKPMKASGSDQSIFISDYNGYLTSD